MKENNESRLLPIVKVDGTEYLVDIENREFRDFKNPDNVVNMHSKEGRQMVRECNGQEWRRYGLDSPVEKKDVIECAECGHMMVMEEK